MKGKSQAISKPEEDTGGARNGPWDPAGSRPRSAGKANHNLRLEPQPLEGCEESKFKASRPQQRVPAAPGSRLCLVGTHRDEE